MEATPIEVLYIAGEGRSGSTILGSLLEAYPGFFHAGELRYIWEKGLSQNRLCGCGLPFASCEFWNGVLTAAYGDRSAIDAAAMQRAAQEVSRLRQRPAGAMFAAPPRDAAGFAAYTESLARLYAALRAACGGRIIVDSSKSPYYLFALTRVPGLRLKVLHLVRDPRAVAFSRGRRKRHPDAAGPLAMHESAAPRSARKWVETNHAVQALVDGQKIAHRVVRYEDFVAAPAQAVAAVHALLGRGTPPDRLIDGRSIELGSNHTVWGNPDRFRRGRVELRLDEEWLRRMSGLKRAWIAWRTRRLRKSLGY